MNKKRWKAASMDEHPCLTHGAMICWPRALWDERAGFSRVNIATEHHGSGRKWQIIKPCAAAARIDSQEEVVIHSTS